MFIVRVALPISILPFNVMVPFTEVLPMPKSPLRVMLLLTVHALPDVDDERNRKPLDATESVLLPKTVLAVLRMVPPPPSVSVLVPVLIPLELRSSNSRPDAMFIAWSVLKLMALSMRKSIAAALMSIPPLPRVNTVPVVPEMFDCVPPALVTRIPCQVAFAPSGAARLIPTVLSHTATSSAPGTTPRSHEAVAFSVVVLLPLILSSALRAGTVAVRIARESNARAAKKWIFMA